MLHNTDPYIIHIFCYRNKYIHNQEETNMNNFNLILSGDVQPVKRYMDTYELIEAVKNTQTGKYIKTLKDLKQYHEYYVVTDGQYKDSLWVIDHNNGTSVVHVCDNQLTRKKWHQLNIDINYNFDEDHLLIAQMLSDYSEEELLYIMQTQKQAMQYLQQ